MAERKSKHWTDNATLWTKLKPIARTLRHEQTPTEDLLWLQLRDRRLKGLRFRRQHPIRQFIVDFYCSAARLVVEVDGDIHIQTAERDAARDEMLRSLGLTVLRVKNRDVQHELKTVLERIAQAASSPRPG